jgi:hypothetical protein
LVLAKAGGPGAKSGVKPAECRDGARVRRGGRGRRGCRSGLGLGLIRRGRGRDTLRVEKAGGRGRGAKHERPDKPQAGTLDLSTPKQGSELKGRTHGQLQTQGQLHWSEDSLKRRHMPASISQTCRKGQMLTARDCRGGRKWDSRVGWEGTPDRLGAATS